MQEITYNYRHVLAVWSLSAACVGLLLVYGWCANSMMMATMKSRKVVAYNAQVVTKIAMLEASLNGIRGAVTLSDAEIRGFVEPVETAYIVRNSSHSTVSVR